MPRNTIRIPTNSKTFAKLDNYDYHIERTDREGMDIIKIKVRNNRDVTITDIGSDINRHDKNIFVEGRHYWYLTSFMSEEDGQTYYDIHVKRQG